MRLWSRQRDLLRAVRDHNFVACRAGRKVSKSCSAAVLSLWWSTTRRSGKVILSAPTADQIRDPLWVEIRKLYDVAVDRGIRLGPEPSLVPSTGWQLGPGHSITGRATNKSGRIAGKSGADQLYVLDEATDYNEEILRAIVGNLAGGGKILLISNPRQVSGTFFDAFHDKAHLWHQIHIASTESPNFHGDSIGGLATREWFERMLLDWGEGTPDWEINVEGNFPTAGLNVVVSLKLLEAAKLRWDPGAFYEAKGRLHFGVDPSRGSLDRTVIVPRRGSCLGPIKVLRGGGTTIDGGMIAGELMKLVKDFARPGERPKVKVDGIGIGVGTIDVLNASPETRAAIELCAVNSSERADDEDHYRNLRAQLHFGVRNWIRDGGGIPNDDSETARLLRGELVAPKYSYDNRGRYQVESKDDIRARIDRSPDHFDGLALSIYESPSSGYDGPLPGVKQHASPIGSW